MEISPHLHSFLQAPPDRREIFAATSKPSLRILSWTGTYTATSGSPHTGTYTATSGSPHTGTYTATSGSPHTGAKKIAQASAKLQRFIHFRCLHGFAAYGASFTFQFRELAPAGDKNVLCRQQAPEGRSRQVPFLFRIQSHI